MLKYPLLPTIRVEGADMRCFSVIYTDNAIDLRIKLLDIFTLKRFKLLEMIMIGAKAQLCLSCQEIIEGSG